MKAKYARLIRRGILRAQGDIKREPIFMPLTTKREVWAYHEYTRRYANTKGTEL